MKMGIIGAVACFVLSHGGIHIQGWEWWGVMGCMCAAFAVGVSE